LNARNKISIVSAHLKNVAMKLGYLARVMQSVEPSCWGLSRVKRILQHPRQITARELTENLESDGFEDSKRTIERDLLSLSEIFPSLSNEKSRTYGWSWNKDAEFFHCPACRRYRR
jgi:hypothetical protein